MVNKVSETRRFYTLDALRGVAAIGVVFGHTPWTTIKLPHFYLAVDLFFMLSGFVIAYAYEQKLQSGMSPSRFMLARYVRLYPLYLVGTAIGIASALGSLYLDQSDFTAVGLAIATIAAILMLPSPTWGSTSEIAPLNQPAWSLYFEIAINIVFALICPRLKTHTLMVIVAISAAVLIWATFQVPSLHAGFTWSTIWVGAVRVTFSFTAGVLLFRLRPAALIKTNFAYLAPLFLLVVLGAHVSSVQIIELGAILILFPAIIVFGSMIEPHHCSMANILGIISYPLYVIHEPVISLISKAFKFYDVVLNANAFNGILIVAVLSGVSLILHYGYDMPVRRTLGRLLESSSLTRSRATAGR